MAWGARPRPIKQTRRQPPLQQQRLALTKATRACRAEKEACGSVGATSVGPRQAQTDQTLSKSGKPRHARGADFIRAGERRSVQGQGNTTSSRSPACRPSAPHCPRRSPRPQWSSSEDQGSTPLSGKAVRSALRTLSLSFFSQDSANPPPIRSRAALPRQTVLFLSLVAADLATV